MKKASWLLSIVLRLDGSVTCGIGDRTGESSVRGNQVRVEPERALIQLLHFGKPHTRLTSMPGRLLANARCR